jgi:hypothetical protein
MDYKVNLEGFEGQDVVVTFSFLSGAKLFVNGERISQEKNGGQMLLHRNDGREAIASWKSQLLGLDVPQLLVDETAVALVEPLEWYEIILAGAPILLVFVGGMISAIAAAAGFFANANIFRSKMDRIPKYIAAVIVTMLVVVVYFVESSFHL